MLTAERIWIYPLYVASTVDPILGWVERLRHLQDSLGRLWPRTRIR